MEKKDIKEKFLQSFIIGYKTTTPPEEFWKTISDGLGGIIFFAENFKKRIEFRQLISKFKNSAKIPLFLSTDQEGGLVERTIFLDEKVEYITPQALSNIQDEKVFKKHYEILSQDLKNLGINMNFAPVLDVNSNPNNPIIGVRSFGNNPETVNKYAKYVLDVFKENNIISCGKHYAGHGDTTVDSHLNMPNVDMNFEEFNKTHLTCFEEGIKNGVDTMMISHVHFSFFDKEKLPCSLSKNAIDYLKNNLNFKGLILSDDMVMGGISKHHGLKESIVLALKAGIEVMLFQNISIELIDAINQISAMAVTDKELQNIIMNNYNKIINFKKEKIKTEINTNFDIKTARKEINKIAAKTILIKKNKNITLNKNQPLKIISFNNKDIFNLSSREKDLSDFLKDYPTVEIKYPINPDKNDIEKIINNINDNDKVIFISYNPQLNNGQFELFDKIRNPKILVNCGLDYDTTRFTKAESIISLSSGKTPSLKALAKLLTGK